jgi:hypothetical protein
MLKLSAILLLTVVTTMFINACTSANASAVAVPNPKLDAPLAKTKGEQTAGLCRWLFLGVEAVFDHVKGVSKQNRVTQVVQKTRPSTTQFLQATRSRGICSCHL